MDIIKQACTVVSNREVAMLVTQAWQYISSMWEAEEGVCPHCLNKLIVEDDKYVGHEEWCWFLRAQNWLSSNGEKVPEIYE